MKTTLTQEIEAFERMKHRLEADHFGEWAVVHGGELAGTYPSFERAGEDAADRFGEGPYLIRQIGIAMQPLPTCAVQGVLHA